MRQLFKFLWKDLKKTLSNEDGFNPIFLLLAMLKKNLEESKAIAKGKKPGPGSGLSLEEIGTAIAGGMDGGEIKGGEGGMDTGIQQTPQGEAPTWSPYSETGQRIPGGQQNDLASAFNKMYAMRGPQDSLIAGRGEVLPGYGVELPTNQNLPTTIPHSIRNKVMNQVPQPMQETPIEQQTYEPYPGFFAGLKEGLLGIPSTAREPLPTEKGRQTAYYAGKLIPDIYRSKLGISTTGEEARSQKVLEAYGLKEYTPEFKTDLQRAITLLPNLDETEKIQLFQELSAKYTQFSSELKRIFFPTTSDDLIQKIIAGL